MAKTTEEIVFGAQALYKKLPVAQLVFDHLAQFDRNRSESTVDRIVASLNASGHRVPRGDVVHVFRALADAGCGRFMVGRRGSASRLLWDVEMVPLAKAASGHGESAEVSQLRQHEPEDLLPLMLTHRHHLRSDMEISLQLPQDLTQAEAARLSEWLKTLVLVP